MIAEVLSAVARDTSPTADISVDLPAADLLKAVSNRRRREVIRRLAAAEESAGETALALGDLAEYVAAVENECGIPDLASEERKTVYIGLYQCHLPTLERLGVVDVDDETVVRPVADVRAIADLLTLVEEACADSHDRADGSES